MSNKLNIFSIEILSKKSGIPQDILLSWKDISHDQRIEYFFDHKDSEPGKGKYIRVVRNKTMMKKFHLWLGEELRCFDSNLHFTINGGVKSKSILNGINIHIRKKPFTFVKSDLTRFFESVPRERVYTLFCSIFSCSKEVAEIITNCITFPGGALNNPDTGKHSLARGLHVSSRVAIWCSIQFFQQLHENILLRYKEFEPRISYYIDDIGISLLTTEKSMIEEFIEYMKSFARENHSGIDFLVLHPEKTKFEILTDPKDSIEYLGSRIYMNKKDVSEGNIKKGRNLYFAYQKTEDKNEKGRIQIKLKARKDYRKRIRGQKTI